MNQNRIRHFASVQRKSIACKDDVLFTCSRQFPFVRIFIYDPAFFFVKSLRCPSFSELKGLRTRIGRQLDIFLENNFSINYGDTAFQILWITLCTIKKRQ